MVDFSIKFEPKEQRDSVILHTFLTNFKARLVSNIIFEGKLFIDKDKVFFHIKPLIYPLYYLGFVIWSFGFLIFGWFNKYVLITGLIPFISYPFYNKYWYVLMLYFGLKKHKYKGRLRLI